MIWYDMIWYDMDLGWCPEIQSAKVKTTGLFVLLNSLAPEGCSCKSKRESNQYIRAVGMAVNSFNFKYESTRRTFSNLNGYVALVICMFRPATPLMRWFQNYSLYFDSGHYTHIKHLRQKLLSYIHNSRESNAGKTMDEVLWVAPYMAYIRSVIRRLATKERYDHFITQSHRF